MMVCSTITEARRVVLLTTGSNWLMGAIAG